MAYNSTSGYSHRYDERQMDTDIKETRNPADAPIRKLTVDLIKTYRTINEVNLWLYNMQGYETIYKVCNNLMINIATVYVLVLLNVM